MNDGKYYLEWYASKMNCTCQLMFENYKSSILTFILSDIQTINKTVEGLNKNAVKINDTKWEIYGDGIIYITELKFISETKEYLLLTYIKN